MEASKTTLSPSAIPPNYNTMVLLIDDQAFVAEAVRRALHGEPDIDFHYCLRAGEALALARQIRPTVVLLDLVLIDGDGLSVLREFRAQPDLWEIPIVMLSTKEDPQTKSDSFSAGANDYLVKLPDRLELLARVRYHSRACLNQQQRDEAYRALRESQRELLEKNMTLLALNRDLQEALSQVKRLEGLLPICSYCKKIRDQKQHWMELDEYISEKSDAKFSHGVCPDCLQRVMSQEALSIQPGAAEAVP